VKKNHSAFLGILSLLVVLILAAGCYKPAAPDVTETAAGEEEATTTGEEIPDIEATAIARSTQSAATMAAQPPAAEGEEAEEATEAPATTEPTTAPATSSESPVATSVPVATAVPTSVPAATPVPTSVPPTTVPAAPTGEATTHIVQPGENMFRIALRYGVTVEAIAQANGIANTHMVYVGQRLTIPATGYEPAEPSPGGTTYVVQPGDNLFRIALRYNIGYLELAQYNGIANPANIYVGQVIRIPPR
jgi:LysM repeat protein